jgi:hypothetical protein
LSPSQLPTYWRNSENSLIRSSIPFLPWHTLWNDVAAPFIRLKFVSVILDAARSRSKGARCEAYFFPRRAPALRP